MSLNPRVVKESFTEIEPFADKVAEYFYGRLFAENPRLRALFPPAMDLQRERLFRVLTRIVWTLDAPESLTTYLTQLGRDHRKFGVVPEHFESMGRALLATLRNFSGDTWSAEVENAWATAFATAAEIMIRAADEDASPPWWVAEVVEHERRTADIAVLAVRPGHRLAFTAGQHVSVQVKRWPRIWRPMSIANAPREDGALRFHVRALPAGWVSGSLVRHTRIGDTLLLGPPVGTMTLDPESDRDLLLVAGGTGLAPLKALVEQVIISGRHRNIHLVFGARTERDLYDLPDLRLLESTYPWLRIVPVVSEDPSFEGMQGLVSDVLDQFHDWTDHDCYVAGPDEMIRQTVRKLLRLGVATDRIHHDPLEPLY